MWCWRWHRLTALAALRRGGYYYYPALYPQDITAIGFISDHVQLDWAMSVALEGRCALLWGGGTQPGWCELCERGVRGFEADPGVKLHFRVLR